MARKSANDVLQLARSALEEINGQLNELFRKRKERLLAGDATDAISKIDAEIDRLRRAAKIESDRIGEIEAAAVRQENERRERERQALRARIERKFEKRAELVAELENLVGQLTGVFYELIDTSSECAAAWNWPVGDLQGTLLAREAIVAAVANEFFRQSAKPLLGGGQNEGPHAALRLPGSKAPHLGLINLPGAVPPITNVFKAASDYASDILHGRRPPEPAASVTPTASSTNGHATDRERTPAERRLTELYQRQASLASLSGMTPQEEIEYSEIVNQIAIAQAQLEAEKQVNV